MTRVLWGVVLGLLLFPWMPGYVQGVILRESFPHGFILIYAKPFTTRYQLVKSGVPKLEAIQAFAHVIDEVKTTQFPNDYETRVNLPSLKWLVLGLFMWGTVFILIGLMRYFFPNP
jgi:hypothetical protein